MKLIRHAEPGKENPGVILSDGSLDASAFGGDYDEAFFASGGTDTLQRWLSTKSSNAPILSRASASSRRSAGLARSFVLALNFREHAAESEMEIPKEPVIFVKSPTSLVGPNDPPVIPKNGTKVDWEVELAVIIGKRALYVGKDQALDHIAGYALHNDYSERTFQLERGGQWVKGKSADTFAPLGPFLATQAEIPDSGNLQM